MYQVFDHASLGFVSERVQPPYKLDARCYIVSFQECLPQSTCEFACQYHLLRALNDLQTALGLQESNIRACRICCTCSLALQHDSRTCTSDPREGRSKAGWPKRGGGMPLSRPPAARRPSLAGTSFGRSVFWRVQASVCHMLEMQSYVMFCWPCCTADVSLARSPHVWRIRNHCTHIVPS